MTIKNILFDLDGTLVDSRVGITKSIQYALEKLGARVPPAKELLWCIGPALSDCFKKLLDIKDDIIADNTLKLYRKRYASIGIFENTVYAGVPAMLKQLQGDGFALYVASSKPRVFVGEIVNHVNLTPCFRKVYGSELSGERFDKKELIDHLLDTEKLAPQQTLMIGDRKYDILGAGACGVKSIGVTYGFGSLGELKAAGAEDIAESPGDILRLVCR